MIFALIAALTLGPLVWSDEFDGDRLDTTKWSYRTNFWGKRASWFATPEDGAVVVTNGAAHLKIVRRADGSYCSPQLQTGGLLWDDLKPANGNGVVWPFLPRTAPKFMHRYGYYEARVRTQRKAGWWTAFWMQAPANGATLDPRRSGVECDIMESFDPGFYIVHAFHYNGCGGEYRKFNAQRAPYTPGPESAWRQKFPLSLDEWHTFGMLWEPDGYTIFVDGVQSGHKVGRGEGEAVSETEEFLLVSTELKGFRKNNVPDKEVAEAYAAGDEFVVDYVRVYDLPSAKKDKIDVLCIYYPEWHVYPEGDQIFGKGHTEWDYVNSARPLFEGHEQPVELLAGNPDDADPEDVAKEIDLASEAGIDVFVYDWYWADHHPIEHEALERGFMRAKNRGKMKFALMWANHNRSDVFRTPPGFAGTHFWWKLDYSREEFLEAIDYCIRTYFHSPEYYLKDGKLFFSVYSVHPLVEGVGGAAKMREMFAAAQKMAKAAGLPPIHFSAMVHGAEGVAEANACGFDSTSAYNITPYDFDDTELKDVTTGDTRQVFTHEQFAAAQKPFNELTAKISALPHIPVVGRGWDCSPRCIQTEPFPFKRLHYPYLGIVNGMKPELFGLNVREMIELARKDPKQPGAILINAWNEYTEGSYLMPDKRHGDAFLKELKKAVGK